MMKLECGHAAVVPADRAAATRLQHEALFHSAPPSRDALLPALLAAEVAPALEAELGQAMVLALQYSRPLTGQPGASSKGAASASVNRESVLLEPVRDARGTPIDGAPDLAERCSGLHQRPELLLRKVTLVR